MIEVKTSKPIAYDSPDHLTPVGTSRDNSFNQAFNRKLYELIPAKHVRLLDIGCAGGGFVKSVLDDGGFAIGIEGSDYSKVRGRAEWATIPDNLFTADVTEPFEVAGFVPGYLNYTPHTFNTITMWEVWEHIAEDKIEAVADNIKRHLAQNGFFLGTIADTPDVQEGIVTNLHQTVKPMQWWAARFRDLGFKLDIGIERHFGKDLVRQCSPVIAMRVA